MKAQVAKQKNKKEALQTLKIGNIHASLSKICDQPIFTSTQNLRTFVESYVVPLLNSLNTFAKNKVSVQIARSYRDTHVQDFQDLPIFQQMLKGSIHFIITAFNPAADAPQTKEMTAAESLLQASELYKVIELTDEMICEDAIGADLRRKRIFILFFARMRMSHQQLLSESLLKTRQGRGLWLYLWAALQQCIIHLNTI